MLISNTKPAYNFITLQKQEKKPKFLHIMNLILK